MAFIRQQYKFHRAAMSFDRIEHSFTLYRVSAGVINQVRREQAVSVFLFCLHS
jgi:hypothetical protein